ncbi:Protein phosphatase 1 regulatory subunit 3B [Sparganum proliferum]
MIELGYNRNSYIASLNSDWTMSEDVPAYADDGLISNTSPWKFLQEHDFAKILKNEYTHERVLKKLIAISQNPCIATTTFISTRRLNKTSPSDPSEKEPTSLPKSIERWLLKVIRDKAQLRHSLTNLTSSGTYSCSKAQCTLSNLRRSRPARSSSSEREIGSRRETDLLHRRIEEACEDDSSLTPLCLKNIQIGPMFASRRKRLSLSDSEISYTKKEGQEGEEKLLSSGQEAGDKTEEERKSTDVTQPIPLASTSSSEDAVSFTISDQPKDDGEGAKNEEVVSNVFTVPCKAEDAETITADSPADGLAAYPPSQMGPNITVEASTLQGSEETSSTPDCAMTEPDEVASDKSLNETSRQGRHLTHSLTTSELHKKPRKAVRFADEEGFPLAHEHLVADSSLPPLLHRKRLDSFDDDYRDFATIPTFQRSLSPATGLLSGRPTFTLPPVPVTGSAAGQNATRPNDYSPSISSDLSPIESSWRLTFAQPAAQYLAFRQRLDAGCVSLENVTVSTPKDDICAVRLYGTVKVKNISFEKHVKLRVTDDQWKSFKDYPATHNSELSAVSGAGGRFDTFIFNFSVRFPDTGLSCNHGQELQFAVCFQAGPNGSAGEYWDNNDGCNYVVQRQASPRPMLTQTNSLGRAAIPSPPGSQLDAHLSAGLNDSSGGKDAQFFRVHPPKVMGAPGCSTTAAGDSVASISPPNPYTIDFRPNFAGFSSLTSYSSWQHYSSESMYY